MIASTASLIVATLLSAGPAATTCGHRLNPAGYRHHAAGVEINCEDLPCPCSTEVGGGDGHEGDGGREPDAGESCTKPDGVQRLVFSASKYPNIRRHFRGALRRGWPRRLVLNRPGADARRDRLVEDYPTREGRDRDEYPPTVGRGKGKASSAEGTRAAGRPTCATCPARRTVRMVRRSAPSCRTSATALASDTSSAQRRSARRATRTRGGRSPACSRSRLRCGASPRRSPQRSRPRSRS